jgi:hypothetical protein
MSASVARHPAVLTAIGLVGIALVVSGLAGTSSSEQTPSRILRPFRTGIYEPAGFLTGEPLVYSRVRAAGGTFARFGLSWRLVAPRLKPRDWNPRNPMDPNYSWGPFDTAVKGIVRAGLIPVVAVAETPGWAIANPKCDKGKSCAPKLRDLESFARAAALRYSGRLEGIPRVRYWQAWAEPNVSYFLLPQRRGGFDFQQPQGRSYVAARLYRGIVNAFAAGVKGVAKDNLVIAGGLQPWISDYGLGALAFMRQMLCMSGRQDPRPRSGCDGRSRFDIWSTHPYTSGPPNLDAVGARYADDVSIVDLPLMSRLLSAAESAGRIETDLDAVPFWVDEFSWDTDPPDPNGVPWRLHARWTANALYRMWAAGVSMVMWFQLRDAEDLGQPHGERYDSGLYLRGETIADDRPKRSLRAFEFPFVALRRAGGIYVWGRTPDSSQGLVSIEARSQERWTAVLGLRSDRYGVFHRLIPAADFAGPLRARANDVVSLPYPMKPFKIFFQHPFGLTTP